MISLPGGGSPICGAVSIPNLSNRKPFRKHLPLEIFLVVREHLVGLRHNPDLSMSVSDILNPYIFPTYICVILDVHRVRNKCNRFALEENLLKSVSDFRVLLFFFNFQAQRTMAVMAVRGPVQSRAGLVVCVGLEGAIKPGKVDQAD